MIISVYNAKGGVGKTSISANIMLDKKFNIGTNDAFHIYESFVKEGIILADNLLAIDIASSFPPEIETSDIDIIFDLAGTISNEAKSITSAIAMSDIVLVPICNEYKSFVSGLNSITEIKDFKQNIPIVVIATKIIKDSNRDEGINDIRYMRDFLNIEDIVHSRFPKLDVVPLKYSKVFDNIFDEFKSINQLYEMGGLNASNYKNINNQFNDLYKRTGIT